MLKTLSTLARAFSFEVEETVRDKYSVELINQKIREAEGNMKLAKTTLASLIIRHRNEEQGVRRITAQIADFEARAEAALTAGKSKPAGEAAAAIADLENEKTMRDATIVSLEERISQIRSSIEKANRRLTSLKQGAVAARAVATERAAQKKVVTSLGGSTSFAEAEELIARLVGQSDPFEEAQVLEEIDSDLSHTNLAERMAEQGFGPRIRANADDVLERLQAKVAAKNK